MKLPPAMTAVFERADALPDEAIVAMAQEMAREWVSKPTLDALMVWLNSNPAYRSWNDTLVPKLGDWVVARFGPARWTERRPDGRPVLTFVRPALQGACLGMTAFASGGIDADTYREACRPWLVGLAVGEL